MAIQQCAVCGRSFRHDQVGRPPRNCPEHRAIKVAPKVKAESTVLSTEEAISGVDIVNIDELRPNKYAGKCQHCGLTLMEREGVLFKPADADENTHSKAFHKDCLRAHLANRRQGADEAMKATELMKQGNASEALEALKQLAESLAPKIDEDAIRAIVDSAIGNGLSDERIKALISASITTVRHEIVINNETIELPKTHHHLLPAILKRLAAGIPGKRLNLFLPGPAGSGKSTVVMQAAELIGANFASMSLGPTTPTSKFFGFVDANGRFVETDFYRIYTQGGVFLIDEMDNGHPGLLAELNQALANPTCAFANGMAPKHLEFRCCATGNTFGTGPSRTFSGRNILDFATLDRFVIKEFPIDEAMERNAAMAFSTEDNAHVVARYIALVQSVRAKVAAANNGQGLPIIVSPRASIDGAMMLSGDIPVAEVIEERLIPGMVEDTRRQLDVMVANLEAFMAEA